MSVLFFLRYAIPPEHGKRLERLAKGKLLTTYFANVAVAETECSLELRSEFALGVLDPVIADEGRNLVSSLML